MNDGSVSAAELATLSLARPGFGIGGGYGYGYPGIGAGHLPNLYLAEQNKEINRDLIKGTCDTNERISDSFFKSLVNTNDKFATQNAFIDAQNDNTNARIESTKDTVIGANNNVKDFVLQNGVRSDAQFTNLSNRLCGIEKSIAENKAIAEKNHEISLLTMAKDKEINEIRRVADLQVYGGCRPHVVPNCCSTPCPSS